MSYRTLIIAIAGVFFATTQAGAVTYNYRGNQDLLFRNYITATVELNCPGVCSGLYTESAGLLSFKITVYDELNNLAHFVSTESSGYHNFGLTNYLSISPAGIVINWFLLISTRSPGTVTPGTVNPGVTAFTFNEPVGTLGQSFGLAFDLYDYVQPNGVDVHYVGIADRPGEWTGPAVPLPAAFPLFAGGLSLLGLFAWRRKRMAAAAS